MRVLCLAFVFGLVALVSAKNSVVKVKGQLFCPSDAKKHAGVKVLMVDKDTFTGEDEMGSTKTDKDGNFEFTGQENESGTADPRLKIYHNCDDGLKPGERRWKFEFPSKYINGPVLDMGRMNLELRVHDEERNLIG